MRAVSSEQRCLTLVGTGLVVEWVPAVLVHLWPNSRLPGLSLRDVGGQTVQPGEIVGIERKPFALIAGHGTLWW